MPSTTYTKGNLKTPAPQLTKQTLNQTNRQTFVCKKPLLFSFSFIDFFLARLTDWIESLGRLTVFTLRMRNSDKVPASSLFNII